MANHKDVLVFHQTMGLPVGEFPQLLSQERMDERVKFLREELEELEGWLEQLAGGRMYAAQHNEPLHPAFELEIMAEIFDALLDLAYVAHGTAVQMGLPWELGWDEVQRTNMAKERGEVEPGTHKLGIRKPPGWKPPDLQGIILKYRAMLLGKLSLLADTP